MTPIEPRIKSTGTPLAAARVIALAVAQESEAMNVMSGPKDVEFLR